MYDQATYERSEYVGMNKDVCFLYGVLKVQYINLAQWLSWLERRPVTAEVTGSSPVWVVL